MLPRILSLRQKLLLTFLSLWLLTVVIATLAAYWFSGNAALAAMAAAAIPGAVNDNTRTLLGKIEALEDAAKTLGTK